MKTFGACLIALGALASASAVQRKPDSHQIRTVTVGDGIELHYIEQGKGVPVISSTGRFRTAASARTRWLPGWQRINAEFLNSANQR